MENENLKHHQVLIGTCAGQREHLQMSFVRCFLIFLDRCYFTKLVGFG
ncbi:hypothetical protein [uncultured Gammaproteobacteria bacterium]|nr:hypothetical protein [uncultured Gammaproteobacteria bacterium]CAC9573007.1 hypothetical protein [uncultured Gammaproteobacteria bacterium]CAC9582651.1 hypothetical protein [uncultured Gammaproteobacteria bacterium]